MSRFALVEPKIHADDALLAADLVTEYRGCRDDIVRGEQQVRMTQATPGRR